MQNRRGQSRFRSGRYGGDYDVLPILHDDYSLASPLCGSCHEGLIPEADSQPPRKCCSLLAKLSRSREISPGGMLVHRLGQL